ncbi:response regulator [Methylobacterium gnaphalii]|uniref:response regulator n=1 Tax=Methylobacterium gnaphalii TaxID=1010610 RepID=UPI001EE31742|nr:response regulator [Methylobacterium gnaphalii]
MSADHRPVAIVVAESDEVVRMTVSDMLRDAGYRPISVRTTDEALSVLTRTPSVRVLIVGRSFAGDGVGLAHAVYERRRDVGIIITSGVPHGVSSRMPPGARLLVKPYTLATLLQEVEQGLQQSAEAASAAPMIPRGVLVADGASGSGLAAVAEPAAEPDKS